MKTAKILPLFAYTLAFLYAPPGFAQDKQQQLDELRRTIERLQAELAAFDKTESSALEHLRTLDKEIDLTSRLVGQLRKQETSKRAQVAQLAGGLEKTEKELARLSKIAARRAVFFYKYGRMPDLEMLLRVRSVNQVLLWAEYQRRLAENDRRLAARLSAKQQQTRLQQEKLTTELEVQKRLLAEKQAQDESLRKSRKQRQELLKKLRKDKAFYRAQLAEKKQAAEAISRLIAADASSPPVRDELPHGSEGPFPSLKGRLPWPVAGKIQTPYGEFRHPVLNTITRNLGIDIAAPPGAEVRSVAAGRVLTVSWQRGYGNLVIITHADGYYTVYTHLADIWVAHNEMVTAGQVIGRVAEESSETQVVHFQIWQRTREQRSQDLNPMEWLRQ